MRKFKVESMQVNKKYASIIIEAEDREEAVTKARSAAPEEFTEVETASSSEWTARTHQLSFWEQFKSIFSSN